MDKTKIISLQYWTHGYAVSLEYGEEFTSHRGPHKLSADEITKWCDRATCVAALHSNTGPVPVAAAGPVEMLIHVLPLASISAVV